MPDSLAITRLTPEQFKALAKYKGWKFKMLAERWGLTPEWVSNISRDPKRDLRYDDALIGLPNLHKLARDLRARNRQVEAAMRKAVPGEGTARTTYVPPGYRYRGYLTLGMIVTASEDVGSMAEEGMRGIVFQIIDNGKEEIYGIIFETGLWDWFAPQHIDACLATTGLVAAEVENYRYRDEVALQEDFAAGMFDFWPVDS